MGEKQKDNDKEKAFSENVDRMLTGNQPEISDVSGDDYRTAVEFAQTLIEHRPGVSPSFKAELRERLLSGLTKEGKRTSVKRKFNRVWGGLALHRPVWQKGLAAAVVIAMIAGLVSINLAGLFSSEKSVFEKASAAILDVSSFHVDVFSTDTIWYEGEIVFEDSDESIENTSLTFQAPDRVNWTVEKNGEKTEEGTIIGDFEYSWNALTDKWLVKAGFSFHMVAGFPGYMDPANISESMLEHTDSYEKLPDEIIDGVDCQYYREAFDNEGTPNGEWQSSSELWFGKDDYLIRQTRHTRTRTYSLNPLDEHYGDIPVAAGEIVTETSTTTRRFYGFNEPVEIETPPGLEEPGEIGNWSQMDSGTTHQLFAIWGSSSSDVFAVGQAGTILHYDGDSWSTMVDIPTMSTVYINDIWGTSSSDVFAAGSDGTILHYDGISWSVMVSGTTSIDLRSIWGSAPDDVFAIGGDVILHYDGDSWSTMVDIPTKSNGFNNDIWGTSSSDVFAVVGKGDKILHYDGITWSEMYSSTTSISLHSIWGSAPDDVYVAGLDGIILHYDGNSWSDISNYYNCASGFLAVSGTSASDIFFGSMSMKGILHYDGDSTWIAMENIVDHVAPISIWGSSASDVFAVGVEGVILHYGG